MALAIPTGVDGSFTTPTGHTAKIDTWALTVSQAVLNVTGFDSGGFEENRGGLKKGRGSATGHFKYGTTGTSPGSVAMTTAGATGTFQVATGCTIAATLVVSDVAMSSDVNGDSRVSFNFVTSGTITETWAVS